jgi:hypothetical protein
MHLQRIIHRVRIDATVLLVLHYATANKPPQNSFCHHD